MFKAYKYRIYPTSDQLVLINKHFGACRFVYNLALETKMYAYKHAQKNLTTFNLCKQMAELKQDCVWLKEVDSQALQASIKLIDVAYKNFFTGSGFPKFKSKHSGQSFSCPNNARRIDFEKQMLTIPKIKDIPIVVSREFSGKIKTVTISKTPTGKYFASILVETMTVVPAKPIVELEKTIGFDLGLKEFLISSAGETISNPRYLREGIDRLKVLQRRASKKKKGGKNRKKANLRVAIQHERIANKRNDFLQKLSSKLVRDNQATTFCFESLAVKNLVKNHRLAQAITDVSWSRFLDIMKYKCEWYGKNLIQIGAFVPSSKTCSSCGNKKAELSLSVRTYECESCGLVIDRDENAAINIKNFGLKQHSGEGIPGEPVEQRAVVRAMKQEKKQVKLNGGFN